MIKPSMFAKRQIKINSTLTQDKPDLFCYITRSYQSLTQHNLNSN